MIKNITLTLVMLSTIASFSQYIVNSTPIELKKNRDVFQSVNNDKNEVTLFVSDKSKVKAILLNEKMQIIDSISTERPNPKTYSKMIGFNTVNNNTRLYWASDDCEEIFSQLYDFKNRKIETEEQNLIFKDEKILHKFSDSEKFYLLTMVKKSNTLKLHIFDKEGKHHEKAIDLSNFTFYNPYYNKTTLWGIFQENYAPFEMPFTLQNIDVENPTSITDSAKKRKCYVQKNQLIITLDNHVAYTQVIIIDLENFTATEKIVKNVKFVGNSVYKSNSNSFLFDDKLFLIKTTSDLFYFTIKDLDNNIIKEYFASEDKPIAFKNSEINQEGSDFGDKRVLEKTGKFIRKVNALEAGLTCYNIGGKTLITFGAVSENQQTTGQMALMQFGLVGSLVSAIAFNPTMQNFDSYANRKVVKIEGLFDKDGNHLEGELKPLAFDKIQTFFEENSDLSSQTLFKMTDNYYLGYYDNKNSQYIIRKFTDQ